MSGKTCEKGMGKALLGIDFFDIMLPCSTLAKALRSEGVVFAKNCITTDDLTINNVVF